VREEWRIGDDVIVGIGAEPGCFVRCARRRNIGGDAFEALGFAVGRRVLTCESGQAGIDLDAGNFRVRNTGQETKGGSACPASGFKHMIPRLRRACGGKEYSVQAGSEPRTGLAHMDAAIQKSVTRKVEMTGHAQAGILK
jgi:hypothetical protein